MKIQLLKEKKTLLLFCFFALVLDWYSALANTKSPGIRIGIGKVKMVSEHLY